MLPKIVIDKKWWVLLAIGVGTFMTALGMSVVNTTLPVIKDDFSTDIATIEWVITIYLLVVSGLLLTFGRIGDMRGHKKIFIFGFFIFVASSMLCAWSYQPITLITFRGIQAVGGAMLAASSPAILTGNFPAKERGRALGLSGMITYLGLTVGPSLGGWLAQQFSWRAVFFINVPVGILGILLSLVFIPADAANVNKQRFDIPGAFFFLAGLVALLLGLNKGSDWGWASLPVLGLLAGAILLLTVFVIIERRTSEPMLDLRLFQHPVFSAATGSAVLNYICVYTLMFLTPFYLIQGRGLNTAEAGLLLTVQPIVMAIAAPISGALSDRIGSRWPAMIGMFILSVGLFILSSLSIDAPIWILIASLGLCGLGTGIFISPNNSALMGSAPKNRQGVAAATLASSRNVGMMLGIGLAGAIFTSHLASDTTNGFLTGLHGGYLAAAIVALVGVLLAAVNDRHGTRRQESGRIDPDSF